MIETKLTQRMPTKLEREPLIDAVFEMRFNANGPASSILPGLIYSGLAGARTMENMPVMSLPKEMRERDENLRYAPLVRIGWGEFWLFVGDNVFSVASKLPYTGWSKLRDAVLESFGLVCRSGLLTSVTRYSTKYVDLISAESGIKLEDIFSFSLSIGGHEAGFNDFQVRADISDQGLTHIIGLVANASTQLIDQPAPITGAIVDIDSYENLENESPEAFLAALSDRAEVIHSANKKLFFNCLSQKTLEWLEPKYE